jgi:hypothetical protein
MLTITTVFSRDMFNVWTSICVGPILVPSSTSGFHCYSCCKLAGITYIVREKSQDGMPQGRGASSCSWVYLFASSVLFYGVEEEYGS